MLWLPVALDFEIEGPGEDHLPGLGAFAGQFEVAVDQCLADIAAMRPGEREQPVAAGFGEPFAANFRPVAPTFDQIGSGQQFAKLPVAGLIAHQ